MPDSGILASAAGASGDLELPVWTLPQVLCRQWAIPERRLKYPAVEGSAPESGGTGLTEDGDIKETQRRHTVLLQALAST